jgi:SH3-like domain-containing protein
MEAQYNLGYLFFENKDDPELMRKGLDWWRRSAVQGFSIAQFNYGGALFYGIGEEKNLSAAKFWIEQSARSGEQVAINFLEKNAADFAHLKQSKTYIKNSEQPAETPENSFEAGDAAVAGQQENSASDQGATAIVEEPPAAEKQQEKAQEQKKVELTIDEFVSQLAGGTATGSGNENSARVESSNDQKIHRVNNSGIQLLDSPELNAEPMFKVSRGTLVAVNSVEKDWARASIPGGLPVWLPASAISIENNIAVVDKNRVEMSLLPEAGSHKAALGELGKGVRLEILDVDDQWVRVLAPQQVSGWVLLSDLDPETGSDELNREWRKQQRKLHNLFDKY